MGPDRAARHGVGILQGRRPLRAGRYQRPREDPSLRGEKGPLYAFPRHALYSVGIASVGLGIARGMLDAFVELTSRKTPRGTGRLADNAVIQAELARSEARLGAARGYQLDSVTEIYRRTGPTGQIDVMDRARVASPAPIQKRAPSRSRLDL